MRSKLGVIASTVPGLSSMSQIDKLMAKQKKLYCKSDKDSDDSEDAPLNPGILKGKLYTKFKKAPPLGS